MELLDFISLFYSNPQSYVLCAVLIGIYKIHTRLSKVEGKLGL